MLLLSFLLVLDFWSGCCLIHELMELILFLCHLLLPVAETTLFSPHCPRLYSAHVTEPGRVPVLTQALVAMHGDHAIQGGKLEPGTGSRGSAQGARTAHM